MSDETKKVDDGGSAFPDIRNAIDWQYQPGMTLRDYFAGLALNVWNGPTAGSPGYPSDAVADWAYKLADAMIERRKM